MQMANRRMKRGLSVTDRQRNANQMHSNITSYLSIIKKTTNNKYCCGNGEKGILLYWEQKLVQLLWRTVWRFLRKTKNRATIYPASPLLGIYVKNTKTLAQKDTCALTCTAALFTTTETWAQPRCPSAEERTRKMWYVCMCVCVYIGLSLSHKKE